MLTADRVAWSYLFCCSAIPLPPSSYPLFDAYPESVVQQGKLSQLQLEGVLYACSRHQQILPSGERAGFFIGGCARGGGGDSGGGGACGFLQGCRVGLSIGF
jgi:uncharacterized membrane protein YgcG